MQYALSFARVLCALIAAALCFANAPTSSRTASPQAQAAPTLKWKIEPSLKFPRSAHAIAATDEAIFVVGGTGATETSSSEPAQARPILEVERFDGKAWSVETSLPGEGLNAPAAVIFERKLWVIGGFGTTSNVPVATVRTYDFESRAWSEAPELPAARGGHAAIVFGGRIHVFGGGNSVSTLAEHCAFDPAKRAWEERAPLSRSKGSPAAVVFEGKLWAIGGRSGSSDFGDVECYDGESNRWSPGPPIEPRGTAGAVVWRGAIWVVGGESQAENRCLANVLRFDPATRKWSESSALPTARNYARTVVLGEAMFVVGGSTTAGFSHQSAGGALVESARILDADRSGGK